MRFRNSVYTLIDNFSNVFKLLLYRLMTGAVFLSLIYVILSLNLKGIVKSEEAGEIFRLIKEFLLALTSGQVEYLQSFKETFMQAIGAFLTMLQGKLGSIIWSVVGVALIYLLQRFTSGLGVFAVGCAINDRMQTYSHSKFSSCYFKELGRASLYQVIYVPLVFLYDILTLTACWFFFFYALSFLPLILTIALAVTAVVCLQALKFSFTSAWIPGIITGGDSVCGAMKKSFRHLHGLSGRFASFLVSIYLIIIINVLTAVCTLGSGLFLSVPVTYIYLLCMQFVHYNEDEGKKYFISYRKIVNADDKPNLLGE